MDMQQKQARAAKRGAQPTASSCIRDPDVSLRQGGQINLSFKERPAPDKAFGGHNWPRPPMSSCGHAGTTSQRWSKKGMYPPQGQRLGIIKGSSGFDQPNPFHDHNLRDQQSASPTAFAFTSQQLQFQPFPTEQQMTGADVEQQSPNSGLPQEAGPYISTNHFGLPTLASSDAHNSPFDEAVGATVNNPGSQDQQLWDRTCDAAQFEQNVSDIATSHTFLNGFGTLSDQQLWNDIDFDFLDGLFGVNNAKIANGSVHDLDEAAPEHHTHFNCHLGRPVQHPSPPEPFDPFLTGINYPDTDPGGISIEFTEVPQSMHPDFMGQTATYYPATMLQSPVSASDTPSPAASLTRPLAKPSQRDNAKNALLIHYKEQGMSYKDIKAIAGFDEAESTLRGRYRTLTKPKEERVRKPEWSERDVSSPFIVLGATQQLTSGR